MSRLGGASETIYRKSINSEEPGRPAGIGNRSSTQGSHVKSRQRDATVLANPGVIVLTEWTSENYGDFKGSDEAFRALLRHKERVLREQLRHKEAVLRLKVLAPLFFAILVLVAALAAPESQPFLRDLLHAFLDHAHTSGH